MPSGGVIIGVLFGISQRGVVDIALQHRGGYSVYASIELPQQWRTHAGMQGSTVYDLARMRGLYWHCMKATSARIRAFHEQSRVSGE